MAQKKTHLRAKKEIETVRNSDSRVLDLSRKLKDGNALQFVAEQGGVEELSHIQSLRLRSNGLMVVPDWVKEFSKLQYVDISDNLIMGLPEWIGSLANLRSLILDKNQLAKLPDGLRKIPQLENLSLSDNQLTALPEWIAEFVQMRTLHLGGNRLTDFSSSFAQFQIIESLDVSRNKISELPEWLGLLSQLRSLDVSYNELKALPSSLSQLTELRFLNIGLNRLAALPNGIGLLINLQELKIGPNRIVSLPESLQHLVNLKELFIWGNKIKKIPDWIGKLSSLEFLGIPDNAISELPETISNLVKLNELHLGESPGGNPLKEFPVSLRGLKNLRKLDIRSCGLNAVPDWLSELSNIEFLGLQNNRISELPPAIARMDKLQSLHLDQNPLSPELNAAHKEGLDSVKSYLRAKSEAQILLCEAKLILVGEGEVGKSCLLGALRGDEWDEKRSSTHGIEIKSVKLTDASTGIEMTLNGWDFGGQRVYRPTHQLFFTAPAVYLVVWKPREGPQQGFVKEWIKLVKHREPAAKIIVVATHGGPKERQPDIDRQELWDLFGKETVIDFFHVDSRPHVDPKTGLRNGERAEIKKLKATIARIAANLPEMGRSFPRRWQEARLELRNSSEAYLPLNRVVAICKKHGVQGDQVQILLRICRRVGDLIHYEHDPILHDVVVLKPDWLATAISLVLDDKHTREVGHGLVSFGRLGLLWNDPERPVENRYPLNLHFVFLRLMERFDLSYRVAELVEKESDGTSLIAQLVPDFRPEPVPRWPMNASPGDEQQVQICRIVDSAKNQSATAEGLFYQLIVRLHKYSLGRANYKQSVHWQRGLLLEDDTGSRAFLEHVGNNIRITVRSPYPQRFLAALTYEVKWLVESFWTGLRCEVTVPCLTTNAQGERCAGLFEVAKLIENKKRNRPEQPCALCNEWQSIDQLLHNAPAAKANPMEELLANSAETIRTLQDVRRQLGTHQTQIIGRFDHLDTTSKELVSKVEAAYTALMRTLLDEAKEGPRLFSFEPVDPGFFDRPKWLSEKFRVTLWCEHARLPLPALNGKDDKRGVYELSVPRDWFVSAAPFLKSLIGMLSLVVPVASSATKLIIDDSTYKGIEKQLNFGEKGIDAVLKSGEIAEKWLSKSDGFEFERENAEKMRGGILRQVQSWLKDKDPGFGGLVRVQNKRQEFLWVHPKFEKDY